MEFAWRTRLAGRVMASRQALEAFWQKMNDESLFILRFLMSVFPRGKACMGGVRSAEAVCPAVRPWRLSAYPVISAALQNATRSRPEFFARYKA